jgi:hypothetical protein
MTDNGFVPAVRDDEALPADLATPRRTVGDRLARVGIVALGVAYALGVAAAVYALTLI